MTSQFQLQPTDVNYLTSRLRFNNLAKAQVSLTIPNTVSGTPTAKTFGDGQFFFDGAITVTTGSPTANMQIASLPTNLIPDKDYYFPISTLRAGAHVSNALKVTAGGYAIGSVNVTTAGTYSAIPTVTTTGNGDGATFAVTMKAVSDTVGTAQSGGGSYAPNDTITLTGGTFTTATVLTVTHTKVVSATVAAGGSGGTNGTQTVTGTTGTGTKFQASVTITGGAITAVNSITVAGDYTVNPTILTSEPVTGAGLTGAGLNVVMGVLTATVTTPGNYSVLPSNPVAQGSTSGSGTGATFNITWGLLGIAPVTGGSGFDSNSGLSISGAGGGAASIVLGASTQGTLNLINAPNQNDIVKLSGSAFVTSY